MRQFVRAAGAVIVAALLATAASAEDINGEVKKIDASAGKITLKHGPAKSLGMDEGMTMVYRVKDPAMLQQVKFEAENTDGGVTVTKLQKSK